MPLLPIHDADDPRLEVYRDVRDRDLHRRAGLFMAEGRLVVRTLLQSPGFRAHSLLVTEAAWRSLADACDPNAPEAPPVYLAPQPVMDAVTGFHIHRGCLAAAHRPPPRDAASLIASLDRGNTPRCVVVLEDVANHDNVGGVFRSAAAFAADAVLLTQRSCDPLYRKAIRVSMGGVLRVPFATIDSGSDAARLVADAGFQTVALTPATGATDIAHFPSLGRVAIFLGAEGAGLSQGTLDACMHRVRIPITDIVDSLNLSVAAAIALHRLTPHPLPSTP